MCFSHLYHKYAINVYMKHPLQNWPLPLLVSLLIILTLTTCRRKDNDVTPSGEALLLKVGIPGFPAENIQIDHQKSQVILTVPANGTAVAYEATSFQLSPGSSIWRQKETQFNIDLCRGYGNQLGGIYVLNSANQLKIYKFVIKPAGDLKVSFVDNQPTAVIGRPLYLQIDNLSDGSGGGLVILTRAGTAERDTLWAYCCNGLDPCAESQKKQFLLGIPQRVRPGDYTVDVQKENGRRAVAKQKLSFKKGKPTLESSWLMKPVTMKSRNVVLRAQSLFADDNPEIVFRRTTGESYRVKAVSVSPYGWNMTVDLPANMPAGYYDAQLVVRGQPTDSRIRIAVVKQPEQPAVAGIEGGLEPVSASPLSLQRDKSYAAQIHPQIADWGPVSVKLQIKLTPLDEKKQPVLFIFTER